MTPSKNFNKIYNDIINNNIKKGIGLNQIFSLFKESHTQDIEFEIIEILNKLHINNDDVVDFLIQILISDENEFIKLIIAKFLIQNNIDKSFSLLKKRIKLEFSAYFITSLYKFLNKKDLKICEIFKNIIIDHYREIYDVVFEEAKFFLDLETTQMENPNRIDFKVGYFNKFKADNLEILKNDSYYNYLIRDSHIISLNLSRWDLKELPESIGSLSKLQYLSLANLKLKSLPESIKLLSYLTYLNLCGNNFKIIPRWLTDFIERKFSQKYINEGVDPNEARALGLIEILKGNMVEKANIESDVINWEIVLNYKININGNIIGLYIDDEKTGIGIFPEILCTLTHLQELVLSNSSIKNIPNCIGELQALKYLDLSFNRIRSIPESINTLRSLEYLNLNDNEIPEKTILSIRWNKSGQIFIDKGDYDKAILECKETLEIYPRNKSAWLHLGIANKEKGDYSLAERAFKRFLEIDPFSCVVLDYLSDIYHNNGEYLKAISMIQQAIAIEPNLAILWSNLGFNFKKIGKYDQAIDAYLHSLEIDPKNQNVWKDLASIYRDKGNYMKAIEADERALELELHFKENKVE
ncbi:MAG: tetratricopeptide repeat protein [Candidatus Lokiarchaeota archaeon]|nr:tetratricopeptide repeat protein [Candidatus Lokiarchaeota archaeon]